ncbi:MAG: hypothetical protein ABIG71_03195 [Candidatus Uhrbacteria bacterium]
MEKLPRDIRALIHQLEQALDTMEQGAVQQVDAYVVSRARSQVAHAVYLLKRAGS